jgi:hypothetical protein
MSETAGLRQTSSETDRRLDQTIAVTSNHICHVIKQSVQQLHVWGLCFQQ